MVADYDRLITDVSAEPCAHMRSAALDMIATAIDRALWNVHARDAAAHASYRARSLRDRALADGGDLLTGMDKLAASGRLSAKP